MIPIDIRNDIAHATVGAILAAPSTAIVLLSGNGYLLLVSVVLAMTWAGLVAGALAELKERGARVMLDALSDISYRDVAGYGAGAAIAASILVMVLP